MRSPELPKTVRNLKVGKFKKFLQNCGGQLLIETNEYEIIRVQTSTGVLILYKNKSGFLNWPPELRKAWESYKSGGKIEWRAADKPKMNRKRGVVLIKTLWKRDGKRCWYCGKPLTLSTTTIEHLLSVTHGGNNHLSNLAVADEECNQRAKNMSIPEKVKLRERLYGTTRLDVKGG